MAEMNDDELLDALGVEVAPLKFASRTPREERIIAGFEGILRFHQVGFADGASEKMEREIRSLLR